MVLLENISVNELVLLSGLEVHTILITELLLKALEVLIQKDLLEYTNCGVKLIILHILA